MFDAAVVVAAVSVGVEVVVVLVVSSLCGGCHGSGCSLRLALDASHSPLRSPWTRPSLAYDRPGHVLVVVVIVVVVVLFLMIDIVFDCRVGIVTSYATSMCACLSRLCLTFAMFRAFRSSRSCYTQ